MARALNDTQMETPTSANSNTEKPTAKVSTPGRMARSTMASGTRESSKATEYGKAYKVILILESGPPLRLMAMAFTFGPMAIDTKVSGKCVSSMVRGLTALRMAMFTQESMLMESHRARASMSGRRGKCTLESL